MKISFCLSYSSLFYINKNILFAMQLLIFVRICFHKSFFVFLNRVRLSAGRYTHISSRFPLRVGGLKWTFRHLVASQPSGLAILRHIPFGWWAQMDSDHRPHAYQACALTSWAMSPSNGGGNRVRTDDFLLAGQALYQLSYTPISCALRKINAPLLPREATLLKTNKKETIESPID